MIRGLLQTKLGALEKCQILSSCNEPRMVVVEGSDEGTCLHTQIMFSTSLRQSSTLAQAVKKLLPQRLPPSLSNSPGNLYEILSRTPTGGVGREIHQIRWSQKQINNCWWRVTRTKFKCEGKHGKAWGHLYWKGSTSTLARNATQRTPGKLINPKETQIRGSLKYTWAEGRSTAPKTASETAYVALEISVQLLTSCSTSTST